MFTILIHMIAYNALYKSYGIKNSSGVIWGHRGQKVIRIQKIFKKSYLLGAIQHIDVIWSDERSFTSVASIDTDMGSKVI